MNRLNYYNPYDGKSDKHEDRFTRGLLVLTRLSPLVATYLYALLKAKAQDQEHPEVYRFNPDSVEIATQRDDLPPAERYYSVLISDDNYVANEQVTPVDRIARYDGVLQYGESVFFIEVKPFKGNVWEGQLSPSAKDIPEGSYLAPTPICISTRTVLTILDELLENPAANSTERQLISDFRIFVNEKFPDLNPFDTYAKSLTYQLAQRKTESLLQEIARSEDLVRYHQGWGHYIDITDHPEIRKIGLLVERDSAGEWTGLKIAADFGSTQGQAKAFYSNPNVTLSRVKEISGATPAGNLHFSKITSNVIHFTTAGDQFDEYFNYWKENGPSLRQIQRDDFEAYYAKLKNAQLIQPQDANFTTKVMGADYQNLNVCPAVYFTRFISKNEVLELEAKGQLTQSIFLTLRDVLGLLGRSVSIFAPR